MGKLNSNSALHRREGYMSHKSCFTKFRSYVTNARLANGQSFYAASFFHVPNDVFFYTIKLYTWATILLLLDIQYALNNRLINNLVYGWILYAYSHRTKIYQELLAKAPIMHDILTASWQV